MTKMITALAIAGSMATMAMAGGDVAPIEVAEVVETPGLTGFYIGGAYSYNTAELSTYDNRLRLVTDQYNNSLALIAGYNINDFVAVEGRYTILAERDYIEGETWSIFVKPQYPVTSELKVYGLVGFGGETLEDVDYGTIMDNETSFQYGAGLAYNVTENVEVFADYTIVYEDSVEFFDNSRIDLDTDAVTVGVNYKF